MAVAGYDQRRARGWPEPYAVSGPAIRAAGQRVSRVETHFRSAGPAQSGQNRARRALANHTKHAALEWPDDGAGRHGAGSHGEPARDSPHRASAELE